jgi:hypothetical protein
MEQAENSPELGKTRIDDGGANEYALLPSAQKCTYQLIGGDGDENGMRVFRSH